VKIQYFSKLISLSDSFIFIFNNMSHFTHHVKKVSHKAINQITKLLHKQSKPIELSVSWFVCQWPYLRITDAVNFHISVTNLSQSFAPQWPIFISSSNVGWVSSIKFHSEIPIPSKAPFQSNKQHQQILLPTLLTVKFQFFN
jgi:hypothetical protein